MIDRRRHAAIPSTKVEEMNEALKSAAPSEDSISELDRFLKWLQGQRLFLSRKHAHSRSCRARGGGFNCGYTRRSFEPMLLDRTELIARFRSSSNSGH